MHKRLRDVIENIDDEELQKMLRDLESGGHHLYSFIKKEVKRRVALHQVYCSNCSVEINPDSATTYTMIFGPHDFKKKATFCGKDCMDFFMKNIGSIQKNQSYGTNRPHDVLHSKIANKANNDEPADYEL